MTKRIVKVSGNCIGHFLYVLMVGTYVIFTRLIGANIQGGESRDKTWPPAIRILSVRGKNLIVSRLFLDYFG
jgi:hypothetical protein